MTTIRLVLACALAALAVPGSAQVVIEESGGAGTAYTRTEWPTQSLPRQPLTLAAGLAELGLPVRIDVSSPRPPGTPDWSIPAYLDFGLSDSLQIGIFHVIGLCLAGDSSGCAKTYDDVGARLRLGMRLGRPSQVALEARVLAFNFDSTTWQGSVQALYKHTLGNLAFVLSLDWTSLLNHRDSSTVYSGVLGTRLVTPSFAIYSDELSGSAEVQLEFVPGFAGYGIVGAQIPINETTTVTEAKANVRAPVGAGVELVPARPLAIGAMLLFPNLIGENATVDDRQLTLYVRLFL